MNPSALPKRARVGLERGRQSDKRFFERFPGRRFRVRQPFPNEVSALLHGDAPPEMPPGTMVFVLACRMGEGVRSRILVPGPVERATEDHDDEVGEYLFNCFLEAVGGPQNVALHMFIPTGGGDRT